MRRQRSVDAARPGARDDSRESITARLAINADAGAGTTAPAIARADDATTVAGTVTVAVYAGA